MPSLDGGLDQRVPSEPNVRAPRKEWLTYVVAGVLLRLVLAVPSSRWSFESDAILGPLAAKEVLDGRWPVWTTPTRLGAPGAYLLATWSLAAGWSRQAFQLYQALLQIATMLALLAAGRRLLRPELQVPFAAVVAFMPPAFLFWTATLQPYTEVALVGSLLLLAGATVDSRPDRRLSWVWLGCLVGLGLWLSLQTACVSAPILCWIVVRHRRALPLTSVAAMILATAVTSAPASLSFLTPTPGGFEPGNYATRPVSNPGQVAANAVHLVRYSFPEILASSDVPGVRQGSRARWVGAARFPALVALGLPFAVGLVIIARRLRGGWRGTEALWLAIAVATSFANILTAAGSNRGLSYRYVLPLSLVAAAITATGLGAVWWRGQRSPVVRAWAVLALGWNVLVLPLPWTTARARWHRNLAAHAALHAVLLDRRVDLVVGDYWDVYPVNFHLYGRVIGLPFNGQDDHLGLERGLETMGRIALFGVQPDRSACLANVAQLPHEVDGNLVILKGAHSTQAVLEQLRQVLASGAC